MSPYRYQGPPEERVFGPLPPGDYNFVVSEITEPHESANGNLVLGVKLSIQPGGEIVFANPWQGQDSTGNKRDDIALFCLAINRVPKIGMEPDWQKMIGAHGRVRLKTEIAQQGNLAGKSVSKVAFFHRPHQLTKEPPAKELPKVGPKPPAEPDDLDMGPTDIPF